MLVCPLCLSSFREIGVVEGFLRSVCVCVCVCVWIPDSFYTSVTWWYKNVLAEKKVSSSWSPECALSCLGPLSWENTDSFNTYPEESLWSFHGEVGSFMCLMRHFKGTEKREALLGGVKGMPCRWRDTTRLRVGEWQSCAKDKNCEISSASYIPLNISQQIFIEEGGVWIGKQVSLLQDLLFKNLFKIFISGLFGSGEKL